MKLLSNTKKGHALVIGGGIAGLLATRVLADFYAQVTLIERDSYPEFPEFRPGAPQGRHVHTMLLKGQQVIEQLFPGIQEKLLASGAIERIYGAESLYFYGGGRCPKLPPVLRGWNCSRLLLEYVLRQEVRALPGVQIIEGKEVLHLIADSGVVCGVQYRERDSNALANPGQDMRADLVVDASGVESHIDEWLQEIGYKQPLEDVVDAHLGYATRWYLSPNDWQGWKGIVIQGVPQQRRAGTLMEVEGGRWMVVLAGSGGDYPPTDEEGFHSFAESLLDPALIEAIRAAQPISPIYGYRRTANRLRRFNKLSHLPAGLIVLGDALCAFNPAYGQGMTVATLEVKALHSCLRSHSSRVGLPRAFYKNAARVIAFPWRLAAGADSTINDQPKGFRYNENLIALLAHDPKVLLTFLKVIHMLQSPLSLFSPLIASKVIFHYVKTKKGRAQRSE